MLRQPGTRPFDIFGAGILQHGDIVHFHIDTIFGIPVLDKDQIVGSHPRFQSKVPTVVKTCRIIVPDTVKAVLKGMIVNPVCA